MTIAGIKAKPWRLTTLSLYIQLATFGLLLAGTCRSALAGQEPGSSLKRTVGELQQECRCSIGFATGMVEAPGQIFSNSEETFPTASVYKAAIAAAFLHLVDEKKFLLDQQVEVLPVDIILHGASPLAKKHPHGGKFPARELLELMIIQSDNSASDAILRLSGGPDKVTAFLNSRGMASFHVGASESRMGDPKLFASNSTTTQAAIVLLEKLFRQELLSKESTAFLIQKLEEVTTGPGRIKGLLPPGTVVAHKTGTGNTVNGVTWAINDIGVIRMPDGRHLAVAIFLKDTPLNSAESDRIVARAAKAAYDEYGKK
jgi:beta-lactamase class A